MAKKNRMEVPLLSILFSVSSWLVVSRVCWGTLGARRGQWQGGDDESSQLLDTNCALRSGPGMHKQPQKKVEMAKVIIYLWKRKEEDPHTVIASTWSSIALLQTITEDWTPCDISPRPWSHSPQPLTAWFGWFRWRAGRQPRQLGPGGNILILWWQLTRPSALQHWVEPGHYIWRQWATGGRLTRLSSVSVRALERECPECHALYAPRETTVTPVTSWPRTPGASLDIGTSHQL